MVILKYYMKKSMLEYYYMKGLVDCGLRGSVVYVLPLRNVTNRILSAACRKNPVPRSSRVLSLCRLIGDSNKKNG